MKKEIIKIFLICLVFIISNSSHSTQQNKGFFYSWNNFLNKRFIEQSYITEHNRAILTDGQDWYQFKHPPDVYGIKYTSVQTGTPAYIDLSNWMHISKRLGFTIQVTGYTSKQLSSPTLFTTPKEAILLWGHEAPQEPPNNFGFWAYQPPYKRDLPLVPLNAGSEQRIRFLLEQIIQQYTDNPASCTIRIDGDQLLCAMVLVGIIPPIQKGVYKIENLLNTNEISILKDIPYSPRTTLSSVCSCHTESSVQKTPIPPDQDLIAILAKYRTKLTQDLIKVPGIEGQKEIRGKIEGVEVMHDHIIQKIPNNPIDLSYVADAMSLLPITSALAYISHTAIMGQYNDIVPGWTTKPSLMDLSRYSDPSYFRDLTDTLTNSLQLICITTQTKSIGPLQISIIFTTTDGSGSKTYHMFTFVSERDTPAIHITKENEHIILFTSLK